jgi:hypothetical protein
MAHFTLVPVSKFLPAECAQHLPGVYGIFWELTAAEMDVATPEQLKKLDQHVLFRRQICVN